MRLISFVSLLLLVGCTQELHPQKPNLVISQPPGPSDSAPSLSLMEPPKFEIAAAGGGLDFRELDVSVQRIGDAPWRRTMADDVLVTDNDWFSGPGDYLMEFRHQPTGTAVELSFTVRPGDRRVSVELHTDSRAGLPRLYGVIARTFRPTDPDVSLRRQVSRPDAGMRYELVNRSSETIYGTGYRQNFFGAVQEWNGKRWSPVFRGMTCGTVAAGQPLASGESTTSIEVYFIGGAQVLPRGRYRYLVRYVNRLLPRFVSPLASKPLVVHAVIHELTDEFQ